MVAFITSQTETMLATERTLESLQVLQWPLSCLSQSEHWLSQEKNKTRVREGARDTLAKSGRRIVLEILQ